MKTIKRKYLKPGLKKIVLDNSISLVMMTGPIDNPDPRGSSPSSPTSEPFSSPFQDSPFN